MADKPWIELGMSKAHWTATCTEWGRQGLTKEKYLEKQGLSAYLFNKLERGERMRAQQARGADQAAAASGATATQEPGSGTKRTQSEADEGQELEELLQDLEDDEEDDSEDDSEDEDDDGDSRDRDGAPSPDSDASFIP